MNQYYELTQPQRRIWVTQTIYPESPMYNIGGNATIYGNVNIEKLQIAIQNMLMNHDAFRIRITQINNHPYQYFCKDKSVKIHTVSFLNDDEPWKAFHNWVEEQAIKPMVLEEVPLYQFTVYQIEKNIFGYFIKLHHIIADGWSVQVIADEIKERYECLISNKKYEEELIPSYLSYIKSEEKYLNSERYKKDKKYWETMFESLPDKMTTFGKTLRGRRESFLLTNERSNMLRNLCQKYNFSLNSLFVALYLLYIHKQSGKDDLVIGNPVLGRSRKKERKTVGMFVSSMPFRYKIDKTMDISSFVKNVDIALKNSYRHQRYPYNQLVKELKLGDNSLYAHCINCYHTMICDEMDGCKVDNKEFYNGEQAYNMQLIIREWSDSQIQLDVDYNVNVYESWQISDLILRLELLVDKIAFEQGTIISDLSLLHSNEVLELTKNFNKTAFSLSCKTVISLFREATQKYFDKVAIQDGEQEITYKLLERRALILAGTLVENGIEKNDIVGLYTTNSIDALIGIWGILMSGAAYMPIVPEYPSERISYMLKDASVSIVLTNVCMPNTLSFNGLVLDIRKICENDFSLKSNSFLIKEPKPDDLAYVIYTSGSTGKPKGVMIQHLALLNYVSWAIKQYGISSSDVMPLFSSLGFDLTVTTLFAPLVVGGSIVVYREEKAPNMVQRIFSDNFCTIIKLTPAHLMLIKDFDNSNLRINRMIVGGENFRADLAAEIHRSFAGNITIYNEYGPTEATVGCMVYQYDVMDKTKAVPIGRPAENTRLYVLDMDRNPVPMGYEGELYIAGHGLAKGYINLDKLTNEKFVSGYHLGEKRMYKTDDIVRFIRPDCLLYLYRNDDQVKIHGYRVELTEVESCICDFDGISRAAVLKVDHGESQNLCAYYIPLRKVDENELRSYLSTRLPSYMIPVFFISLDSIPLTRNGKIDTDTLRHIFTQRQGNFQAISVAQYEEKEQLLIRVLSELLNIDVSLRDNFYQVGGDSIKAIQLSSKIQEYGYALQVKDIMSHPIFIDMANCIRSENRRQISQNACSGEILPLPIIDRFFRQSYVDPNLYCQSIVLKMKAQRKTEIYQTILNYLVRHHDALRICVGENNMLYYANEVEYSNILVERFIKEDLDEEKREQYISNKIREVANSIDLVHGKLLQSAVYRFSDNTDYWLIVIHHLAIDAVSWRILLDAIQGMLSQISQGQTISLPLKTDSYQYWTKYVNSIACNYQTEREFWVRQQIQSVCLPAFSELQWPAKAKSITVPVPKEVTKELLLQACESYNITVEELLLTAFSLAFHEYFGGDYVTVVIERHGRETANTDIDLSRTVGWFTTLFPIQLPIHYENFDTHIKDIKELIRKIPNQGFGYCLCMDSGQKWESESRWICFNYLGELQGDYPSFSVDIINTEMNGLADLSNIMEIIGYIKDDRLHLIFKIPDFPACVNQLADFSCNMSKLLDKIIKYCLTKKTPVFTPSDFPAISLSQEDLDIILNED